MSERDRAIEREIEKRRNGTGRMREEKKLTEKKDGDKGRDKI